MRGVDDPRWLDAIIEAYTRNGGEADYSTIYAFLRDKYAMANEIAQMKKTVQRCVEDHCPESAGFKGTAIFRHIAAGRYRLLTARESAGAFRRERRPREYNVPASERIPKHRHANYIDKLMAWFVSAGYVGGVSVRNNTFCDLVVLSTTSQRAILFEAKSACGPYDLYTAVGQLMVNQSLLRTKESRDVLSVLAFPRARYSQRTSEILSVARAYGFEVIHYDDFDAVAKLETWLHETAVPSPSALTAKRAQAREA